MKNFKRYIKLIALVVFVLPIAILLSACGGKTDEDSDDLLQFENIIFESQTIDYSGNENAIFINGILPEGANVAYVNNKATNAGEYNAKATISLEGYKTLQLTAKLIINKINYDMSSASWDYDSTTTYIYNGSEYQVEVINLPQGVTAKQYQSNRQTDAGNYTASVTFNYDVINYYCWHWL